MSAVSARPLRAPCVEMKYWSTERPFTEVGRDRRLDDFARRLGHEAAHAGQLAESAACEPRAPESAMMKIGLKHGCRLLLARVLVRDLSEPRCSSIISLAICSATCAQMSTTLL